MFRDMGRDIERADKVESRIEGMIMSEKVKRTRRNFTLSLDKERTEYVQGKLRVAGIGISSFVDMVIGELYDNLLEVNRKSSAEMEADEFLDTLNTLIKKMKGKYKD